MKENNTVWSFFQNIIDCLEISWHASRTYTVFRIAGKFFVPLLTIVNTYISKVVIDVLTQPTANSKIDILFFLIILFIVVLIQFGISKIIIYIESLHQEKISYILLKSILEKSMNSDYSLYDNPLYYDMLNSAVNDLNAYITVIWNVFDGISAIISCCLVFSLLTQYNFLWGCVILLATIPSALINYKYMKKMYTLDINQMNDKRKKDYFFKFSTDKSYAQDIRLYNLKSFILENYSSIWNKTYLDRKSLIKQKTIITGILEIIPEISVIYVNISIINKILNGYATIGDYSFYTELSSQLSITAISIINSATTILDNNLRIKTVKRFQGIPNKISNTGVLRLKKISSIKFENVNFTYPDCKEKTLDNLCFEIQKGEHIAIVGGNGTGKTTIIKLLLRLYDPDSGIIWINNKKITDYSLDSLRKKFSCYFQNSKNYSFTVRENIAISNLSQIKKDESILRVLSDVDLYNKVTNSVNGIDSYLTRLFDKHGIELSGGEQQRLALARCIYRKSDVLIMDEPSSSIDVKTDELILQNFFKLYKNKIIIFTSHRLTDIYYASRIIVLKNGKIVENGSMEELINNNGLFCKLYNLNTAKQYPHHHSY